MPLERLTPRSLEKVWGAVQLEPWFESTGQKIGEVWFEHTGPLPVLVKFLFTSEKLSVQAHPADDYAARHHQSLGKTEMWHVLAAKPGACIAAGFREQLSAERLRTAAESGEIEDLLQWHPASAGDTFFIPAGTVHAIGEGLVLCEIQQFSDVTYRLYDYQRGRELHLDSAVEVSRREPHHARVEHQDGPLVSCEYFTVSRHAVEQSLRLDPPPELLVIIEGSGQCSGQVLRTGEVWYAPPGTPPIDLSGNMTLLGVSLPQSSRL